jgi:hypothetical protein
MADKTEGRRVPHEEMSAKSEMNKAVFLSHASQDAEAARRICEVLRAAGVEVWFDQSKLVGGDAWDSRCARSFGFGVLGLELKYSRRSRG